MTALIARRTSLAPLAVLVAAVAIAVGTQLVAALPHGADLGLADPLLDAPAGAITTVNAVDELDTARADVSFWAARVTAHPGDIVAALQLGSSDLVEARLTGDVTAYLRAEAAVDGALKAQPSYAPALSMRTTILVSLHRFADARDLAHGVLAGAPDDTAALGALGDASLELGDLSTAASAYQMLALAADGSASQVRSGRLAFIRGDTTGAVTADRTAVADATAEGLTGTNLGFYDVTLGETLLATGDEAGARAAYTAALAVRTDLPAALVGLAKLDAFDGNLDRAIAELSTAIAAIPLPDSLARRADLYTLRGAPGDAARAAADERTVDAIAKLAGDAAYVYDRGLSLFLSDHGLDPTRAVRLAGDELATRKDVYGYDAYAWALLNAGHAAEADAPMRAALAAGTRDARLWYHAGLIAAANGRTDEARGDLTRALALGPALDPMQRARATAALTGLR
jgi:tetratricopeptide (TPR) repeat protein